MKHSIATFSLRGGELEWTSIAYATYLPPQRAWSDRFSKRYTFDDVALELLSRPDGAGACFGTHTLYALCYVARVDEQRPILSSDVHRKVLARLQRAARLLEESAFESGGWDGAWHLPRHPGGVRDRHMLTTMDEVLQSTGHHLEWIAFAPGNARPRDDVVANACRMAVREVLAFGDDEIMGQLCTVTHLVRGLCALHGVNAVALVQERETVSAVTER